MPDLVVFKLNGFIANCVCNSCGHGIVECINNYFYNNTPWNVYVMCFFFFIIETRLFHVVGLPEVCMEQQLMAYTNITQDLILHV